MKSISMMTAVALAACLSFGNEEVKAAQDSIAQTVSVTKAQGKTQGQKKKTKNSQKATSQAEKAETESEEIVAFSDTSDCALDTVYARTSPTNTTISLTDRELWRETDSLLRNFIRNGTKLVVTILVSLLFFFVLLLLFIYLIYRTYKSQKQKKTTEPQPSAQPQETKNEPFTGPTIKTAHTSPATSGNSTSFRGYLFDEAIMISGIKYTSIGLGIYLASIHTHATHFFIWVSIIILFIGLGKIAIALLPNFKLRKPEQPKQTEAPAQEKPAEQEAAPSTATQQTENPEDYMPSAQEEEQDTEA